MPRRCLLLLSCFCLLRVESTAEVQHQGETGYEPGESGAGKMFKRTGLGRVVEKRKKVCEKGQRPVRGEEDI
jgi:hypothetical protein